MGLKEIKEKLYKREESEDLGKVEKLEYDPRSEKSKAEDNANKPKDLWEGKPNFYQANKNAIKKGGLISLGVVILLAAFIGFIKYKQSSFGDDQVLVEIQGPDQVRSGKLLVYEIKYTNNNRATLENAQIRITYPEAFKPESNPNFQEEDTKSGIYKIGDIPGKKSGRVMLNGRIYTPKGSLFFIKAEMTYNPKGFSSQYIAQGQIGIKAITTPIDIEVVAPQTAASGDEINYLVNYKNVGAEDYENLKIKVDYPEGFVFSKSMPETTESNNIWYIGRVPVGQQGKITINGRIEGERDQIKEVKAYVGATDGTEFVSYNEEKAETKIAASPLVVSQSVNGLVNLNVNAGDELKFEIKYKNVGNIGLKEVIVTEKIESPVLDYAGIKTSGGYFDINKKTITWKSSDHKDLKLLNPNQEGKIEYSVRVKDNLPVSSENDKNFTISAIAKIDSPDIPTPVHMNKIISSNTINMKVNSKIMMDVKGYYNDLTIPNDGPIPPEVGQETTYTMHWKVSNVNNDVTDAKVESVLPTGVTMTSKISPEDANLHYNERTNSVVWEIGNIPAATGITSPAKEVAFQIKIIPAVNQVGQRVQILKESKFSAHDIFTNENLFTSFGEKTTSLQEDPATRGGELVVE
jgi:hypothetical protein